SDFGGAIYITSVPAVRIETSRFENNRVNRDVQFSLAVNNKGMGGAIASIDSSLFIYDTIFKNNQAQVSKAGGSPPTGSAGGGGDIYVKNGSLEMSRSTSQNAVAGFPKPQIDPVAEKSSYFTGDGGSILVHGEEGIG